VSLQNPVPATGVAATAASAQFYSLNDLARIIGKSPALLYRRLTEKSPQYVIKFARKQGASWLFSKEAVDAAIAKGENLILKVKTIPESCPTETKEDEMPRKLPKGIRKHYRQFYVRMQINGKRLEFVVGPNLDEAKKVLNILKVYADAGQIPNRIDIKQPQVLPERTEFVVVPQLPTPREIKDTLTVQQAVDEFNEKRLKNLKSARAMRGYLNAFVKQFGTRLMASITWEELETFQLKRLEEVKPSTVRKEMVMITAVFDRQIKRGVLTVNPGKQVDRPVVKDAREQVLTEDEFERLLAATWEQDNRGFKTRVRIRPHVQLALIIADFTAMRMGEIYAMLWDNLNVKDGTYLIPESKNGDKRVIPIHPDLLKILSGIPHTSESIVAWRGKPIEGSIKHALDKALVAVKIDDFRPHDLRHRAITRWVQQGFPINIIMKASGHRTISTFLRYANLRASDVQTLVGGKVEPIAHVTYERFMELYRRPLSEPVKP